MKKYKIGKVDGKYWVMERKFIFFWNQYIGPFDSYNRVSKYIKRLL